MTTTTPATLPRLTRLVRLTPRVAGVAAVACGALALLGWALDVDFLTHLGHPGQVAMNPATATCFVLTGIALWLMIDFPVSPRRMLIVQGLAGIVVLVGVVRLLGYVTPWNVGIDRLLFRARLGDNVMAPNTAAAFVLVALALLLLDVNTRRRHLHLSQFFVLAVGCVSLLALIGYLFRVGALYGVGDYIPMALNTAVCFTLLVAGILCARPDRQPVATLLDDTAGGAVARRLLPAAFVVPIVLGYLRLAGARRGWFTADFGVTLFVLSLIVIFNALVWWNAQVQRRTDQRRRLVEDALRISEERHRTIMQHAADGITLVDAESLRILEVNEAFANLLGYTQKELMGRPISDFIVDTPEHVKERARRTLGEHAPVRMRRRYRRKDGSTVDVEKSATALDLAGIRVLCTVVHDITERERAETELRESEERHRAVMEQLAEGIYLVDLETKRIIEANPALERLLGYEPGELKTRTVYDLVHDTPDHVDARLLVLADAPIPLHGERVYRRKDGSDVHVESSASVITYAGRKVACTVVHDITERKALERELHDTMRAERDAHEKLKQTQSALVQTEKLAGLGQMVAGVAHEINNPLAFVSNNVAVLQRDLRAMTRLLGLYEQLGSAATPEQAKALREEIVDLAERMDLAYTLSNLDDMLARSRDGLKRIQQIVKDLRDFARLDAGDLHDSDVNAGIESTVNIVRGLAKKRQVTVDLDLAPLPHVHCYPAKINQVVMNLVTNAIDACPEGGRVTVRTGPAPGGQIRIEVADTGHGIPPEIRQRIFDPFFTTKPVGSGTGLGLSISYGIVRDHGGNITVESEVGRGTTFRITLPVNCTPASGAQARGAVAL